MLDRIIFIKKLACGITMLRRNGMMVIVSSRWESKTKKETQLEVAKKRPQVGGVHDIDLMHLLNKVFTCL